tara:strand:- start:2011 stop:2829 length:819 start_codon:yes stop_codon:yes gene_type:complete
MSENPLGKKTQYPKKYDSGLLYPIPRLTARSLLDLGENLIMHGVDHWHAYEVSWLDSSGKPKVAIGEFFFDANSKNIIESKSLKLYLISLNEELYKDINEVAGQIAKDLSRVSCSEVKVVLVPPSEIGGPVFSKNRGDSIDSEIIKHFASHPDETVLQTETDTIIDAELYSDLFKSNCPVTGQPDWASFEIKYTGPKIKPDSLLSYLCSFRHHQSYHEVCAERIYRDITLQCRPTQLEIRLNYLRRGGIDINIYRSTNPITEELAGIRTARQ